MLGFLPRLVHKDMLTHPLCFLQSSIWCLLKPLNLVLTTASAHKNPETVQTNLHSRYTRLYPFTLKSLRSTKIISPRF